MNYRLDITYKGLKEVVAVKLIEDVEMHKPPVKQIDKYDDYETIGYYFDNLSKAIKDLKSRAKSKKEIPNLMYDFLAWEDCDKIFSKVELTHPELVI